MKEIAEKVSKSFLRIVKDSNCYDAFITNFNKYMVNKPKKIGKKYDFITLTSDFLAKAENDIRSGHNHRPNNITLPSKERQHVYDLVTLTTTELIHTFLENSVKDGRMLGVYGQEIFNRTCYDLFGEDFERDMASIQPMQEKLKPMSSLKDLLQMPKDFGKMNIDEFYRENDEVEYDDDGFGDNDYDDYDNEGDESFSEEDMNFDASNFYVQY